MRRDPGAVRRIDVGDGIYVSADAPEASRKVPLPALVVGVGLAGAALARLGVTADGVLAAWMLIVLAALAGIDLRARVLPNRIIGPAMIGALAWRLAFSPGDVVECLLAAVGVGAFLFVTCLLRPGALGMGDIKLAALLGLALGGQVVAALTIGFVAAIPAAVAVLITGGSGARRTAIPFGPFLGFGATVVLLAS
jgi:leader peptidase (prepilin peptidase) / N-methyltransferase